MAHLLDSVNVGHKHVARTDVDSHTSQAFVEDETLAERVNGIAHIPQSSIVVGTVDKLSSGSINGLINESVPRSNLESHEANAVNGNIPEESSSPLTDSKIKASHLFLNGSAFHQDTTDPAMPNGDSKITLPQVPIAICGVGMRLPGGIRNSSALYDFLINKQDARSQVPAERFNIDAFYDEYNSYGTICTRQGYFIDSDLAQFDTTMFTASNLEASAMDPAQRLLLEVTREALESAGEADFWGKKIGTFIGDFTQDYEEFINKDTVHIPAYSVIGTSDFVLANRLSAEYNLVGPSVTLKTACSATAEAIHQATLAIRSGSCDAAIVGGANLLLTPRTFIYMSTAGVLATDGSCKTFDANADGFARGESVSAMYIKRLDLALRDGNPIRAIIRATGSNGDGGGPDRNFGTPNARTQEALIRSTYDQAGLDVHDTHVVECHGTGTVVGDPLEATAIANCFSSKEKLYIGSVKPNLGHGEGGSAMASVLKSMLALENKTIIPNIKFKEPNPRIPWDRNLEVPIEPITWPSNVPQRISVNSFGLGGSNAHIVLDSAESYGITAPRADPSSAADPDAKSTSLLLLSGNSAPSISKLAIEYREYLQKHPWNLDAMVYTLANRRQRLKLASYCLVDGLVVSEATAPTADQLVRSVAFVFTGQGAQWIGMGKEMMQQNQTFAQTIRHMDEVLKNVKHVPSWTLEDTILSEDIDEKSFSARAQAVCAALQIAYVDTLAEYGVTPAAVVGHSSGEIAAAYAAKILSREQAIIVAYYRGHACMYNELPGGMAAVGLELQIVERFLKPGVIVACENSRESVTISGDPSPLEESMKAITESHPNAFVRQLRVPMAYHSSHMKIAADAYGTFLQKHLKSQEPHVPIYSTVYGKRVPGSQMSEARYWQDNMESPVRFRDAVKQMLQDLGEATGRTVHLEIGPHAALAGPLRQIYQETGLDAKYLPISQRGVNTARAFLDAIGKMYCLGLQPKLPHSANTFVLPDLPTYAWNYDRKHWVETRLMRNYRMQKHKRHELLGIRIAESSDLEPTWRNLLEVRNVHWLEDHRVGPDIVFPAAGYITLAGVAVRQITDSVDFTVSEVAVASPVLIREDEPTEILTSLRKRSLTLMQDSKSWEFAVSSVTNGTWTKHCYGLVNPGCTVKLPPPEVPSYIRKVDSGRWYTAMSRIGLKYGPRFIGMKEISAHPTKKVSAMTLTDEQDPHTTYPIHPCTLDQIFQSITVAGTQGQYRLLNKLFIPIFIEHLYVGQATAKTIRAHSEAALVTGSAMGSAHASVDGETVVMLKGFKGAMLDDAYVQESELRTLAPQWHPSIDFVNLKDFLKGLETDDTTYLHSNLFYIIYILELQAQGKLEDLTYTQPHHEYCVNKIRRDLARVQDLHPDSSMLMAMSSAERMEIVERCKIGGNDCEFSSNVRNTAELLWRVFNNFVDLVEGRKKLIEIYMEDDELAEHYKNSNAQMDFHEFFRLHGLNNAQCRLLEVGAGTGATTAHALRGLHTESGERLYQEYTVTDISAGFTMQCKERFKDYGAIEYKVLDIGKDPVEQGFDAGTYDVVIAANVLHVSTNLTDALRRCHKLLKPTGYLFIQEGNPESGVTGAVFGFFDGWWLGIDDGRVDQPTISPSEWDRRLREAGFTGLEVVSKDFEHDHHWNGVNMISRPVRPNLDEDTKAITLLKRDEELSAFGQTIKTTLIAAGYTVDVCTFGDTEMPPGQDIVSVIDADASAAPLLADIDADALAVFKQLIKNTIGSALLWLLPIAQAGCGNPHFGQILGVARDVRAELGIDLATMELDACSGTNAALAVEKVLDHILLARQMASESDDVDIELEWMYRDGQISISRLHSYPVLQELKDTAAIHDGRHLTIGQRGMLQSLHWTSHWTRAMGPDDIRVQMTYVGMNFLDLAIAMGIVDTPLILDTGYNALGSEGAGRVVAVGANVTDYKIGDRVATMDVTSAVFTTHLVLPARLCGPVPPIISDADVAGLLIPYVTVLWSLINKANMQKGETLLIHSAAGGVGLAAINVARWLGVKFYCTVGAAAKVDFLVETMDVAREDIFHSRNDSFVEDLLRATGGRGVDAVLNSLSGELLHATWRCVAPGGCMLEIGKRDFLGRARIAMQPFEDNRAYFGIDLARLAVTNLEGIRKLVRMTLQLLQTRKIRPLLPTTVFDAANAEDAFRYMQKGVHMGRIVVRMPEDPESITMEASVPSPTFSSDKCYLLIGGNGGLGKAIVAWMASYGARHIMLVSRSAGISDDDKIFLEEMSLLGCAVSYHAGDVADLEFLRDVVDGAAHPIVGCLQMAMVVADSGFLDFSHEDWIKATRPKIEGTLNLHKVLPKELDFFIMTSSIAGALATMGQANYAAANAFLDSFVHYRRSLGLPATVLDIAAIGEIGYVSRFKGVADKLSRILGRFANEQDFLHCLQLTIARSGKAYHEPLTPTSTMTYGHRGQVTMHNELKYPLTNIRCTVPWRRDARVTIYRNVGDGKGEVLGGDNEGLRSLLASFVTEPERLEDPEMPTFIATEIAKKVHMFLMRDPNEIDLSQKLSDLGTDSLVGIELRTWWRSAIGVDITILELSEPSNTLMTLGELAVKRLKEKYLPNQQ